MSSARAPVSESSFIASQVGQALLDALADGCVLEELVARALGAVAAQLPLPGAALASQVGRDWETVRRVGDLETLPVELIADAIDSGTLRSAANFEVLPLPTKALGPHALVFKWDDATKAAAKAVISDVGHVLMPALETAHQMQRLDRRSEQLSQMLRIGAQWSREEDTDRLLEAVAEAAAKLIGAERASIFLWDRPRRKLVGRPALGVEGNVLEVDDSAGIVGAVLQAGEPRRWHAGDDGESEVNRAVDRKLKFNTRSLLAVPMWEIDREGVDAGTQASTRAANRTNARRPIGVFEVINRLDGQFSNDDEDALCELAMQASAAIQSTQLRQNLIAKQARLVSSAAESARVVGGHGAMVAVRATAERVAETDLSVLILGENGTGKEVLARSIHFGSQRKSEPFIAVNCAALVETLLESELFGHEKGAFTDAQQTRQGKFELANGGTLFLDEVGDLSAGGQAKLLRVLEEKKIVRVGGSNPIAVDVRVIAATNQPLIEMVREKKFREDLFFRLNVVTLTLPPLRNRGADILTLAEHFLGQFAEQVGRKLPRFSPAAQDALRNHDWPGNIRELRNIVERVSYLCPGESIEPEDLALIAMTSGSQGAPASPAATRWHGQTLADATRDFQIAQIDQAIAACNGNMTDAAGRLGLHRSNLYRKMRQLGFDTDDEA